MLFDKRLSCPLTLASMSHLGHTKGAKEPKPDHADNFAHSRHRRKGITFGPRQALRIFSRRKWRCSGKCSSSNRLFIEFKGKKVFLKAFNFKRIQANDNVGLLSLKAWYKLKSLVQTSCVHKPTKRKTELKKIHVITTSAPHLSIYYEKCAM